MDGVSFNRFMLSLARQARGINQKDLAEKIDVSQGYLSKLETGLLDNPSDEVLSSLSEVLNYPVEFFHISDRAYDPISLHQAKHRKRASAPKREIDQIHAKTNITTIQIRKLLNSLDFQGEFQIPTINSESFDGDIEDIASMVRRAWKLPRGPIENLIYIVEQSGILVVKRDFGAVGVDGLTITIPNTPPIIFLNSNQPADRMRFTLAHEVGHVVMHDVPTQGMEDEANQFAAAFLMPEVDIRPAFMGRVNLPLLAKLKPVWRVSMQALLVRASTISAIDATQSRYLWQQISASGYRKKEPPELDLPPEQTNTLSSIIDVYLNQLGYSIAEIAKMLAHNEYEFASDYNLNEKIGSAVNLRLINCGKSQ